MINVPESVLEDALARAQELMRASARPNSRQERETRRSLRRLFSDPRAVDVTITLTDEVMRFNSPESAALALRGAVEEASAKGFGVFNAVGLRAVAELSRVAPSLALRIVNQKVRTLTENLILDASPAALTSQFQRHAREGLLLNVNVLGEAVLGEHEADDRLRASAGGGSPRRRELRLGQAVGDREPAADHRLRGFARTSRCEAASALSRSRGRRERSSTSTWRSTAICASRSPPS